MSGKPRYTITQLYRLRESPLVKKPDNLPAIDQWIEPPSEQTTRRTKGQNGIPGVRGDDKENVKRNNPFESRNLLSRQNLNGSGEDVFLGPKLSFASASAASRQIRRSPGDDSSIMAPLEDSHRTRQERDMALRSRAKPFHGDSGSRGEADFFGDSRARNRFRSETQANEDGGTRIRSYPDRERDADGERSGPKRNGLSKSKLDQPWFRTTSIDQTKETDNGKFGARSGWRNTDRTSTTKAPVEKEPQWMEEPRWLDGDKGAEPEEQADHTQEDFEKWKEKMKSGGSGGGEMKAPAPEILASPKPAEQPAPDSMFGMWAGPKADKAEERSLAGLGGGVSSAKVPSGKVKTSRFAGLFSPPPQQEAPQSPPATEGVPIPAFASPPPPSAIPPQLLAAEKVERVERTEQKAEKKPATDEDQAGFERMMQMLRGAGSSGKPSISGLFDRSTPTNAPPALSQPDYPPEPPRQTRHSPKRSERTTDVHAQAVTSPPPPPTQRQQQHHPPSDRNSEFLMNLMQPHTQFNENQIYGQSHSQRSSNDMSQLLSAMAGKASPANPSNVRGPPPGIHGNPAYYEPNVRRHEGELPKREQVQDERLPAHMQPHRQPIPEEILRQLQGPLSPGQAGDTRQFNGPPQWQPGPMPAPPGFGGMGREPGPPPGFQNMGGPSGPRGPPPPGFYQMQAPSGLPNPPSQNMRSQPPPPGFFNQGNGQQPPGFPQNQQPRRSQQPLSGPPAGNYEMYTDGGRRMMQQPPSQSQPPPMSGHMPPYPMQQNRGPGGYQGMRSISPALKLGHSRYVVRGPEPEPSSED